MTTKPIPLKREWVAVKEDDAALAFVAFHDKHYRYVPGWGWMHHEGTHWARDVRLRHFDDARKLCRAVGTMPDCPEADSKRLAKAQTVGAVVQLARADQRIVETPDAFDADPLALNTPAGLIDLGNADPMPRPHAGELLTKITAVAPDFGATPTTWLRFLTDVFEGDADVIAFVRRLLGYALTGSTREQVIAFLHGSGANGKSTLLDTVLGIVGSYGAKVPSSLLLAQRGERHPCDVASLCGVRLAVANEVSEGEHWDEARVKALTGDARLTARFMRQDFFEFNATHKFLIAGNHRPQVRSMDDAMRRRLLLIPFNAHFEGDRRDPDMLAKLRTEWPAILAWLIIGAVEWHEAGLMVPERVRGASAEYAAAMDSLGLWLDECTRQTGDLLDSTKASILYRSYSDWKRARGEVPVSLTRWGEQLRGRGFETYRNDGIRYRRIELLPSERQRIEAADATREA